MKKTLKFLLYSVLTLVALVIGLVFFGNFIYGPDYLYTAEAPEGEGWIKVERISENSILALEDDTEVSLYPFGFTDDAKSLNEEEISQQLFNASADDLYLRKEGNEFWIVRVGNDLISNPPRWFPKGIYGYYDSELINKICMSEIIFPEAKRITITLDEEALDEHLRKAEQVSLGNPDKPDPRP